MTAQFTRQHPRRSYPSADIPQRSSPRRRSARPRARRARIDRHAAVGHASGPNQTRFDLHPNPQFERCLAAHPDDPTRSPQATVTVKRGNVNDQLSIQLKNIKRGLAFDLFTVENHFQTAL
jgi:hypothetical protein